MKLRMRFEGDGSSRVIDLPEGATISMLLFQVNHIANIDAIRIGRDGPLLATSDASKSLHELGVKNLDTLFVQLSSIGTSPSTLKDPSPSSSPPENVSTGEEEPRMVIRSIADDNSCLFNAVAYVLAFQPPLTPSHLRTIVADCILSNPAHFNKTILEQSPEDYVQWILLDNSWGGAIELGILADWFGLQIASVDVQTGRVDLFGSEAARERVYVMYSGIHYDALALSAGPSFPPDCDITRFDPNDSLAEIEAKHLAGEARKRHMYTDLARFTLKCSVCKEALVGERDARRHAKDTGHTDFVEFN